MELFLLRETDPDLLVRVRHDVLTRLRRIVAHAEISEVGSTALAGVIGKGDVDFGVRVRRQDFERTRALLDRAFSRNPRQLSNEQFQGYTVDAAIDVAIQLFVADGDYDVFDRFLSALRSDRSLVDAYNALKRQWNGRPMDDYRAAKDAFIDGVLRRTREPPAG